MNKIVKIALVLVGVLAAVMWYLLPGKDVPVSEAIESGPMNFMFILLYALLAVAVVAALFFTLKNLFSNPQSLKKSLLVIGLFLALVLLSYVMASGTDVSIEEMANRGVATTETTIKRIGTGLNLFFLLVIVAIASMAWGGLRKMSNK